MTRVYALSGCLAFVGFLLSLALHISTFFASSPALDGSMEFLALWCIIMFAPALAKAKHEGDRSWDRGPYPLRILAKVALAYMVVNFCLYIGTISLHGKMHHSNGQYYTGSANNRITVSAERYQTYRRTVAVRGATGHLQFFFLGMALSLMCAPVAEKATRGGSSPLR